MGQASTSIVLASDEGMRALRNCADTEERHLLHVSGFIVQTNLPFGLDGL